MLLRLKDRKAVVMIVCFFVIVVLLILGGAFILRTITEKYATDQERRFIRAFYLAEAGANVALRRLDVLINTDMLATVNAANPNVLVRDVEKNYLPAPGDGIGFLVDYTQEEGVEQFTKVDAVTATYSVDSTGLGAGTYQYTITVTEKADPVVAGDDMWDFFYNYNIESTGTVSLSRKVILTGDFTVRVQKDNFARFALFTDHHSLPSGTTVWFTSNTDFAGPVHTNERFSFAYNPTFDGLVTQHLQKAQFYNGGSTLLLDADSNPPDDVPIFNAGFQRSVDVINLPSSVQKDDLQLQAKAGSTETWDEGIYVPNADGAVTGGIFIQGDSSIELGVDVNENATYTITQGATTKVITVDYDSVQTTVETVGVGTETYSGIPDGVDDLGVIVYANGAIDSLEGTVQKQSEVTISSENDIIITDSILYQEYNVGPPPDAVGKTNLLGILSWGGDIRIGTSCPDDVNIHGTVMARNGVFTVDDWGSGAPRGTATLLGGVITQFYGAFGTFWSDGTQRSGYGRNFIYDTRMGTGGKAPPYFPTMRTFIAFTNDLVDKVTWQEAGI